MRDGSEGDYTVLQPVGHTESIHNPFSKSDADDAAIWVNHKRPEHSLIFGNDKLYSGGIYTYNLQGKELAFVSMPSVINLDIRHGIKLAGMKKREDLLVTAERKYNQVHIYAIREGKLVKLNPHTPIPTGFKKQTYGLGLYHNQKNNRLFVFLASKQSRHDLHQIELFMKSSGEMDGKLVRKIPGHLLHDYVEGILVDDDQRVVYIADEEKGIHMFEADPWAPARFLKTFGLKEFSKDREGIALLNYGKNKGLILVSNQGDSNIKVFDRISQKFLGTIDNRESLHSDGIAATTQNLGPHFPDGLLVAHNEAGTNFALYNLKDLRGTLFGRDVNVQKASEIPGSGK
eukprot:g8555.t1